MQSAEFSLQEGLSSVGVCTLVPPKRFLAPLTTVSGAYPIPYGVCPSSVVRRPSVNNPSNRYSSYSFQTIPSKLGSHIEPIGGQKF